MFEEGIAIRTVGKWEIEDLSVIERLLHPSANSVVVVLRLDNGKRDVWLVVQDVVDLLRHIALHRLAAHDNSTPCDVDLLPQLSHDVPLPAIGTEDGGRDDFRADVGSGEFLLLHAP